MQLKFCHFLDLTRCTRAEDLIVPDWKCNATSDCAVKLTSCVNGTCQCAPGYILDGSFTACIKGEFEIAECLLTIKRLLLHSVEGTVHAIEIPRYCTVRTCMFKGISTKWSDCVTFDIKFYTGRITFKLCISDEKSFDIRVVWFYIKVWQCVNVLWVSKFSKSLLFFLIAPLMLNSK